MKWIQKLSPRDIVMCCGGTDFTTLNVIPFSPFLMLFMYYLYKQMNLMKFAPFRSA